MTPDLGPRTQNLKPSTMHHVRQRRPPASERAGMRLWRKISPPKADAPMAQDKKRTLWLRTQNLKPSTLNPEPGAFADVATPTCNRYISHMSKQWMIDDEWLDWYKLTPAERWCETEKLWSFYLAAGGSLDSEPDSQSPFDLLFAQRARAPHGRSGMRLVRGR